jgi:sugar phosphate isomerase/epimerase
VSTSGTRGFFIGNQANSKARPLSAPFDFALAQGFDSFEWYSDPARGGWTEGSFDADARARLRDTARERGLRMTLHSPNSANLFKPEGVGLVYTSLDFAAEVGIASVNIHLLPWKGVDAYVRAVTPLLLYGASAGVKVSIENIPETEPELFNQVFTQILRIPGLSGNVGMCFDMGHANLCAATRNDYVRFVDLLGPHVPIIQWHAHENLGDGDHHLPLFTGPAGENDGGVRVLVQRLIARGFHGSVVMECWPDRPEVLVEARRRLQAIIAEPR